MASQEEAEAGVISKAPQNAGQLSASLCAVCQFLRGSIAGATAKTIVYPLDRLKMRLQVSRPVGSTRGAWCSLRHLCESTQIARLRSYPLVCTCDTLPRGPLLMRISSQVRSAAIGGAFSVRLLPHELSQLVRSEGVLSLWKGNSSSLCRLEIRLIALPYLPTQPEHKLPQLSARRSGLQRALPISGPSRTVASFTFLSSAIWVPWSNSMLADPRQTG